MPTLPRATVSVSDTAGALAAGLDLLCLWAPVPTNADCTPRQFGSAAAIYAQHGYCEGVEYAGFHFAETNKPVLFVGLPIATPGTIGRENTTGNTGTSVTTLAASGSGVLNEHDGVLTVITGGTIGTSQIVLDLSLDGGRTTRRVRLGTANSYSIPYESITVSFGAGTLVAGDTIHTWHGTGPKSDASGWALARAALAAQMKSFRKVLLIGDLATDTEASALLTQINAYKTSNERATAGRASVFDREPQAALSQTEWRKTGTSTLTFADADDTITRSAGSWVTDGFMVGDVIETSSATNPGPYVVTVVTALVLTVEVGDLADEGPSSTISVTGTTGLAFAAAADTVTRNRGSWLDDGFRVGDTVTVADTVSNDGTYTVAGVTETVLDLGDGLADEDIGAAGTTLTAGQTKAQWIAAVDAEFAPVDNERRLCLCGGRGRKTSPFTLWYFRRPESWAVTLREFGHQPHVAPWRKSFGPTGWDLNDEDGNLAEYDDRVDGEAACAARIGAFRTWANGPNGAFIALSPTRAVDASLLVHSHNVDVVNIAENVVQLNTENAAIGVDLTLNDDGTATAADLSAIEKKVNAALKLALLSPTPEGALASNAVWRADASVVFNVPEPVMLGTLTLNLKGTVHSVTTTIRVVSAGQ